MSTTTSFCMCSCGKAGAANRSRKKTRPKQKTCRAHTYLRVGTQEFSEAGPFAIERTVGFRQLSSAQPIQHWPVPQATDPIVAGKIHRTVEERRAMRASRPRWTGSTTASSPGIRTNLLRRRGGSHGLSQQQTTLPHSGGKSAAGRNQSNSCPSKSSNQNKIKLIQALLFGVSRLIDFADLPKCSSFPKTGPIFRKLQKIWNRAPEKICGPVDEPERMEVRQNAARQFPLSPGRRPQSPDRPALGHRRVRRHSGMPEVHPFHSPKEKGVYCRLR